MRSSCGETVQTPLTAEQGFLRGDAGGDYERLRPSRGGGIAGIAEAVLGLGHVLTRAPWRRGVALLGGPRRRVVEPRLLGGVAEHGVAEQGGAGGEAEHGRTTSWSVARAVQRNTCHHSRNGGCGLRGLRGRVGWVGADIRLIRLDAADLGDPGDSGRPRPDQRGVGRSSLADTRSSLSCTHSALAAHAVRRGDCGEHRGWAPHAARTLGHGLGHGPAHCGLKAAVTRSAATME